MWYNNGQSILSTVNNACNSKAKLVDSVGCVGKIGVSWHRTDLIGEKRLLLWVVTLHTKPARVSSSRLSTVLYKISKVCKLIMSLQVFPRAVGMVIALLSSWTKGVRTVDTRLSVCDIPQAKIKRKNIAPTRTQRVQSPDPAKPLRILRRTWVHRQTTKFRCPRASVHNG